ncbi:hypothetical protein GCM10022246_11290 [Pedobacter ginsengiterrae]|uniref:Uncharacterized protein n=1 Tax=Pedobacter ginsengiterrae TaxID=871696 RepID=A0ABP7P4M9_9SPHI
MNKLFEVGAISVEEVVTSWACIRLPNNSAKNNIETFFTRQIEQKPLSFTTSLTFCNSWATKNDFETLKPG